MLHIKGVTTIRDGTINVQPTPPPSQPIDGSTVENIQAYNMQQLRTYRLITCISNSSSQYLCTILIQCKQHCCRPTNLITLSINLQVLNVYRSVCAITHLGKT